MKSIFSATLIFLVWSATISVDAQINKPLAQQAGEWKDSDGKFINAHGGGILLHKGIYYWYGEIKRGKTWLVPGQDWECYRVPAGGVSCYSSGNLKDWKFEGVVLSSTTNDMISDLDTSKVIERPKVVYNARTKQFVMWMHIDRNDYSYAHAGVAVSTKPTGPFRYLGSMRPNDSDSRDVTVFKDDDGKAYLIHSSENNNTMHIDLLSEDYLKPTGRFVRILAGRRREAPAIFKSAGKYYLVTSDCSGWSPNPASVAVADSIMGSWIEGENPCVGKESETTFQSQGTFILPLKKPGKFLFMADRWNKTNLEDSRYVWLPGEVIKGKMVIKWQAEKFD